MDYSTCFDNLDKRIKTYTETIWKGRIEGKDKKAWLENFENSDEEINALYLLSNFMFFGIDELRELLLSLYRDNFKAKIIQSIRRNNNDTIDNTLINATFKEEINKTKFLAIGNPSESGAHLLYYFRQVNKLPRKSFTHFIEIFEDINTNLQVKVGVERLVFIDDFSGSGSQSLKFYQNNIEKILEDNPNIEIWLLFTTITEDALANLEENTLFDHIDSVLHLDKSFKCFEKGSRYFVESNLCTEISAGNSEAMCCAKDTCPSDAEYPEEYNPLGFENSQLLLSFEHNTPNNTLPIFWYEGDNWTPIFKRYVKIYSFA